MADTTCRIQSTTLARRPSHVQEPCAWATSLALMTADDSAPAGPSAMAANVLEKGVASAVTVEDSIMKYARWCYRCFIDGLSGASREGGG